MHEGIPDPWVHLGNRVLAVCGHKTKLTITEASSN